MTIDLCNNYPTVPPRFFISCLKNSQKIPSLNDISEHIRAKIDPRDYYAVEALRNPNQSYDANGAPLQPFFS